MLRPITPGAHYVLDGIKTAMKTNKRPDHMMVPYVECSCGWEGSQMDADAIRFHFTHCTQARPPTDEGKR